MKRLGMAAIAAMLILGGCAEDSNDEMMIMVNDKSAAEQHSTLSANNALDDAEDARSGEANEDDEYSGDAADDKGEDEGGGNGNRSDDGGIGGSVNAPSTDDKGSGEIDASIRENGVTLYLTDKAEKTLLKHENGENICVIPSSIDGQDVVDVVVQYYDRGVTAFTAEESKYLSTDADGVLFNKDKTRLIAYPQGKKGGYTVPSSVIAIGESAFQYSCINNVTMAEKSRLESIESKAFFKAGNLVTVDCASSLCLKTIGPNAFTTCSSLINFIVHDSTVIEKITQSAFDSAGISSSIIKRRV